MFPKWLKCAPLPRLLLDPFAADMQFALAKESEILSLSGNALADKAQSFAEGFEALDTDPSALTEIVVINGPGNFTALRAAIGFARGLALGLGIPTRGIGVFEVDHALLAQGLPEATLYRDARGERFYEARFSGENLEEISIVSEIRAGGFSAESISNTTRIECGAEDRMQALARLAIRNFGETPLRANYVRPPAAALPSEPPLVILDEG